LPIRPLESRDIDSILAIQSACPEIAQWKAADYERVVHGEMSGWIFETVAEPRAAEQKSGTHHVENSREPSVGAEPDFGRHPEERSDEGPLFDVRNTQAADDQQHRPASAIDAPNIAGFLVARHVAHEIEVLNFAIRPDARRHGSGAALLECALSWARTFSAEQAILEVRSANATALRFYERHQFQIVGRRRNYYVAPNDDALLLSRRLT
jgi:ribosomal protein S18 acetylase RimI-like enzyme